MRIVFVCQKNLAVEMAAQFAMADPFFSGDFSGLPPRPCDGDHVVTESEGRRDPDPERNWPKCGTCGMTMLPLCAANPEDEASRFVEMPR